MRLGPLVLGDSAWGATPAFPDFGEHWWEGVLIFPGIPAMASLRTASPRLKNYFKKYYIPQVCEVLEARGEWSYPGYLLKQNPRFGSGMKGAVGARVWRGVP